MRFRLRVMMMLLFVGFLIATASGVSAQNGTPYKAENKPANLQLLFQLSFRKLYVERSPKEAAALFRSTFPDEIRLRKALRDDLAPEVIQTILDFHRTLAKADDVELGKLAEPEQTEIKVAGATTEEIQKYERGSVAFREFPGGAKQLADQVLRPGVTFYEVVFTVPGENLGVRYHLFYWDGEQWSMVGALWRAFR